VPQKTRYEVPKTLVESTFGASTREIQAMDAWDQRMERMNTSLKKECMAGTSQVVAMLAATTKAMPAKAMPAATTKVSDVQEGNVDIADSQQSALSHSHELIKFPELHKTSFLHHLVHVCMLRPIACFDRPPGAHEFC
jgi:hypothetical protein